MRTTLFPISYLLTIGALLLSACNLPDNIVAGGAPSPTKRSGTTATGIVELTTTQTEVAVTQTSTMTATETPLPEPSSTPTPEIPIAEVVRESNCRVGPAGNYHLVATYQVGQKLEIVAKDLGGGY